MSIGPLWDSWYVDEELGEGRSGKVYKVHKTCYAAVKIIHVPQSEAEIEIARLEMNEHAMRTYFMMLVSDIVQAIDIMNAFKGCPNVVAIEDHKVIQRDALHWDILIRMELLKPLHEYMAKHVLTNEDVVRMGLDISHALEVCAEKRIIHGDIKPDNIFVSDEGSFKLGGFDSACQIHHDSEKTLKNARSYIAPEVFNHDGNYGPTIDLYSLGIVMYRFLNINRLPFMPSFPEPLTFQNREEALQRRMRGDELPDIPDIDPALNAFIIKACAYRPEERYQTAGEFRAELERVRDILKGE